MVKNEFEQLAKYKMLLFFPALFFPFFTFRVLFPPTIRPDFDKLCGRLLKQPLLSVPFDPRRV